MADRQTVTLYIPCYNGEAYIAGCIESVLAQHRRPDEILVIDDGSTDRTGEIAARYPKVTVIRHERNRGLAAARNTALSVAKGDLVASLDADCVADRLWLYTLVQIMKQAPDCIAGVGGMLVEGYQETPPDRFRATYMAQHKGTNLVANVDFIAGANTVFRRSALAQVKGYNEAFRTNGEDVHGCFLLRQCGYFVAYEPAARVLHQRRDTVASVIRMSWAHWGYPTLVVYPATTLARALKLTWLRAAYCLKIVCADIYAKRYPLLPISLRNAAVTPWWAIREWWRIRRSGNAAALDLIGEQARTYDEKWQRCRESSSEPQALYN